MGRVDYWFTLSILQNVKEEILLVTLDISLNIYNHRNFIDAEKRFLHFLLSDRSQPQDSIDYSSALGVPLIIILHDSMFNNIQNNQIGIVSKNKLKKDISRFYDFLCIQSRY